MRFFKVNVANPGDVMLEPAYLKAETWYGARAIARRLWPGEQREPLWTQMTILDGPPDSKQFPTVFELNLETKEIVFAEGYDYDDLLPRTPAAKKRAKKKTAKVVKKTGAVRRKKAVR